MYKSKLQQLCQQELWPLPRYSCIKDGPDHCPTFKASVLVNGDSYRSASAFKSSKEAQNDAAMRAFVCLGSDSTAPSAMVTVEDEALRTGLKNAEAELSSEVLDVKYPYKLQLHTYAQRNHLSLPAYSITSIGPPHARHFVAFVTVGEQDFKSPTSCRTLKEAENDAAKAALMSLSPDGFEQTCPGYVKNLLQEIAQKEGLSLPVYKTSRSGTLHMQMFYSTVEVGGNIFKGKAARSKKLSEINAAEAAYRSLEDCRQNRISMSEQLASPKVKYLETNQHFDSRVATQEQAVNKSSLEAPNSDDVPIKDSHTIVPEATSINKADGKDQITSPSGISHPVNLIDSIMKTEEITHSGSPQSGNLQTLTDPAVTPVAVQDSLAALSLADASPSSSAACQSYLLCNRVRVYPCIPDIKFPKGITLIPIGDSKWVPVCLEFPNEKDV